MGATGTMEQSTKSSFNSRLLFSGEMVKLFVYVGLSIQTGAGD